MNVTQMAIMEDSKMDITQINRGLPVAVKSYQVEKRLAEKEQDIADVKTAVQEREPAVIVEISNEGRQYAIGQQITDIDYENATHIDTVSSLLEGKGPIEPRERPTVLPTIENRLLDVRGLVALDFVISDALEGKKVDNRTAAGIELAKMVMASAYGNGETVEERAINRELGMKHAEYIAENYFDDTDEAKAFLDRVKLEYENDILREKGYEGVGSNSQPWRSYSNSTAQDNGSISINAILGHFGIPDEVRNDPDPSARMKYALTLNLRGDKWQNEIIEAWEKKEKEVMDIFNWVRSSINDTDLTNSWARILKMI